MWTSYRYCIGRHTYVTTMAYEIGHHYYDRLGDDKKSHAAEDIRNEIRTNLNNHDFHIEYSVNDPKPLEMFIKFCIKNNIKTDKDLEQYKRVNVYSHPETDDIYYEVKMKGNEDDTSYMKYLLNDFNDLKPWMDLASIFDKDSHKKVTIKTEDGELKTIECISTYLIYTEQGEYKYEEVYEEVDEWVKTKGYCTYIEATSDSIVSVE